MDFLKTDNDKVRKRSGLSRFIVKQFEPIYKNPLKLKKKPQIDQQCVLVHTK